MNLTVDMDKLLEFCPFKAASLFICYSNEHLSVAFEWPANSQIMRLQRRFDLRSLRNSNLDLQDALHIDLMRMHNDMLMMKPDAQPV